MDVLLRYTCSIFLERWGHEDEITLIAKDVLLSTLMGMAGAGIGAVAVGNGEKQGQGSGSWPEKTVSVAGLALVVAAQAMDKRSIRSL